MVYFSTVWRALRLTLKTVWNRKTSRIERSRMTNKECKKARERVKESERVSERHCKMYIMTCRQRCCWCQYYRFNFRLSAILCDPFIEMPFNRCRVFGSHCIYTEKRLFAFVYISNETVWIELIFKRIQIDLLFTFQCCFFCLSRWSHKLRLDLLDKRKSI